MRCKVTRALACVLHTTTMPLAWTAGALRPPPSKHVTEYGAGKLAVDHSTGRGVIKTDGGEHLIGEPLLREQRTRWAGRR